MQSFIVNIIGLDFALIQCFLHCVIHWKGILIQSQGVHDMSEWYENWLNYREKLISVTCITHSFWANHITAAHISHSFWANHIRASSLSQPVSLDSNYTFTTFFWDICLSLEENILLMPDENIISIYLFSLEFMFYHKLSKFFISCFQLSSV